MMSVAAPNTNSKEQLDSEGNTVRVANLTFIEGILGKGAYGTVRLARRKLTDETSNSSEMHESMPSLKFDYNNDDENDDAAGGFLGTPKTPRCFTVDRRKKMERSSSAPAGDDFFQLLPEETKIYGRKPTLRTATSSPFSTPRILSRRKHRSFHDTSTSSSIVDLQDDEQLVAVKIFQKSILKRIRTMERNKETRRVQVKTALEQVEREIALMKKLNHPNLVTFFEAIDSPDSDLLYMVIEYMPLGEILTYQDDGTFRRKEPRHKQQEPIEGLVDGHFDEFHAALYFVDIMHGLAYLHQHHIVHRDLKPENVLLDARGIAKLSDFGVSHIFTEDDSTMLSSNNNNSPEQHQQQQGPPKSPPGLTRHDTDTALEMKGMAHDGLITKTEGTWAFWSPEMCAGGGAFSGYAADIWAAGVCLYIFVTGKLPFYTTVPIDLLDMIEEANVPYKGLDLSENLLKLLHMTLEKDPTKRAGVGDCLKHPFLLLARAQRVQQLSVELAKSSSTRVVVEERDIQSAFRIVTTMPVVLLKTATKQIQDSFQAAKQRLSSGKQNSFSERSGCSRESSFGVPAAIAERPRAVSVVDEVSLEFDADDERTGHTAAGGDGEKKRVLDNNSRRESNGDSSSRLRFSPFFQLPSFGSSPGMDDSASSSGHVSAIFRRKRESDVSMASTEGGSRILFFGRKRSDMSTSSVEEEDESLRSPGCISFNHNNNNNGEQKRSRIPSVVRRSLSALKRASTGGSSVATPKRTEKKQTS